MLNPRMWESDDDYDWNKCHINLFYDKKFIFNIFVYILCLNN